MQQKILIFINSLSYGGAERVVSHLLNHLKDDFEIHLGLYNHTIDYPIPPEVKVFDLGQSFSESEIKVLFKFPMLARKVNQYCNENGISTSVAFLNRPCYINALMRKLYNFKGKIILCERTHQSTMLQGREWIYRVISRKLVSFSYKQADLILANSFKMKEDLEENFKVKVPVKVIHNPIDSDFIQRQAEEEPEFHFEPGVYYFIAVGGFRKEKNYPYLIEAFSRLKDLKVKLLIVGGGSLEGKVKGLVQSSGLNDKVIFCGFDTNPFKYIKRADCFVLSSYVEGFPNVLLESLACGKAVISTDCNSGPREILHPQSGIEKSVTEGYEVAPYGILTPVNEVSGLSDAMRRMYNDKALQEEFEKKAAARAADFDISVIKEEFKRVFKEG